MTAARRTTALAAALVVLLLAFSGAAWAYWTATASVTTTVRSSVATVTVAQSGFPSLGRVTTNTTTSHTTTGTFTVTSTATAAGSVDLAITAPADGLAERLVLRIWPVASAAACTAATAVPTSNVTTGTWASLNRAGVQLAAGASQVFCTRTTIPAPADGSSARQTVDVPTGSQSATSTLTVTQTGGTWSNLGVTATTVQSTQLVHPSATVGSPGYVQPGLSPWFTIRRAATTGICLDVSWSGGAGTPIIGWDCTTAPNQRWEIAEATDVGPGLVRIRPRHTSGLGSRLAASGTNVVIATASNAASQLWEVQRISTTTYQLVSHEAGLCLALPATGSTTQLVLADCTQAARAGQVLTLVRAPLTLTQNGQTVSLGFSGGTVATGELTVQHRTGTSAWTTLATNVNASSTALTFTASTLPSGQSDVRIVNGTTVVHAGIVLQRTGTGSNAVVTAIQGIG